MDTTEIGDESTITSGRRLRARQTKVENSNEDSGSGRGRSKQKKRKAEVSIESLYLQETNRQATSTPLETIFEAPQLPRKNGHRKGKSGESPTTAQEEVKQVDSISGDDLGVSTIMGGRKLKRLCLFSSHYYQSKQKQRQRKDRAQKLKQLRGVKIPKGVGITIQDVKEVLAKLSDDESEQNENNPNSSNRSMLGLNSSASFYVENIIMPDIGDEGIQNMIEDLQSLQVDFPKEQETDAFEVKPPQLPSFFEPDEPLPFTDPVTESRPGSKSRDSRSRRRSGRVSACLHNSVSRKEADDIIEQPELPMSKLTDTKILQESVVESASFQKSEALIFDKPVVPKDEISEAITTVKDGTKRRKTVKARNEKTVKRAGHSKRAIKLAEPEPVKKIKGTKSYNSIDEKPYGLNDSPGGADKLKESSFGMLPSSTSPNLSGNTLNENNFDLPSPSDTRPKISRSGRGARRQRGKRRVSGVQRPLYHNKVVIPSSDSSSPDSFLKNSPSELEKQTAESDKNDSLRILSVSPSSQMAALSLHSDFFPATTDIEPQPDRENQKKTRKSRRRSSRLVIGCSPSRTVSESTSSLGSYWSTSSPCLSPNVLKPSVLSFVPENSESSSRGVTSPSLLPTEICDSVTEDNSRGNLPRKLSPLAEVQVNDLNVDADHELKEIETFNNGNSALNQNFSGDKLFITSLPDVNETEPNFLVQINNKASVGNKPNDSNHKDHDMTRSNEKCVWETFQENQTPKSQQESMKILTPQNNKTVSPPQSNKTESSAGSEVDNHIVLGGENTDVDPKEKMPTQELSKKESHVLKSFTTDVASPTCNNIKNEDFRASWDSPVISGIFEGKAGIRLGKVYCNNETYAKSPISVGHLFPTQSEAQPQQESSPSPKNA